MKKITCEICGNNDLVKQDGYFVCEYCGTKYSLEEAKKMMIEGTVEVKGTVNIGNPVRIVNNEFRAKLANADNWAKLYFNKSPETVRYGNLKGFDAVWKYYADAELLGANEPELFLHLARFFVNGNIEGFKTKKRVLKNRDEFINSYIRLMDFACDYSDDFHKHEIKKEKSSTLEMLNTELGKYEKQGCYIATSVYGSYDCPQVWTLRRYRDTTLASTIFGRAFIHIYYAVSPTLVNLFGKTKWFNGFWKCVLDLFVRVLNDSGVEDTRYQDRQW